MENSDEIKKKSGDEEIGAHQKPEKKFDTLDPEADLKNPNEKGKGIPDPEEKPVGNKSMGDSTPATKK